jgi:hypothetical protein
MERAKNRISKGDTSNKDVRPRASPASSRGLEHDFHRDLWCQLYFVHLLKTQIFLAGHLNNFSFSFSIPSGKALSNTSLRNGFRNEAPES